MSKTQRILILGYTYPNYSKRYMEVACTGGLLADTLEMVRIHPVPKRYLDEGQRFKAFEWVEAKLEDNPSDPRAGSYRIDVGSIRRIGQIPASNVRERLDLLEASPNLCKSAEHFSRRAETGDLSLGFFRPKEITGVQVKARSRQEEGKWREREREVRQQLRMDFADVKPIDFPEADFIVSWKCDDITCRGHNMKLLQWGLHELHRKMLEKHGAEGAAEKTEAKMRQMLDLGAYDVFMALGTQRHLMTAGSLLVDTHNLKVGDDYKQPGLF